MRVCVFVCVCERERSEVKSRKKTLNIPHRAIQGCVCMCMLMHACARMCVCVCVCVCVKSSKKNL